MHRTSLLKFIYFKLTQFNYFIDTFKRRVVNIMEDFQFEEISSEVVEVVTVQDNNINEG